MRKDRYNKDLFYKNITHRCLIRESIPDFCPYCLKQLRREAELHDADICWVRNNHFKHKERFCIMNSKSLQHICDIVSSPMQVLYFCEKDDNSTVYSMIQSMQTSFPHIIFTKADDDIPDWKQMLLMSCCQSNIVANSSFSWWGAYMSKPDNIVCYPSQWFGPAAHNNNTKDLFPEKWHKINI